MKYAIILSMLLAGCSTTVPVTRKFPEAPNVLLQKCEELKQISEDAKLSDIAKTVTSNYSLYYECSAKNDAWIEWYNLQKQTFESVK
jgi:hypothetical protein